MKSAKTERKRNKVSKNTGKTLSIDDNELRIRLNNLEVRADANKGNIRNIYDLYDNRIDPTLNTFQSLIDMLIRKLNMQAEQIKDLSGRIEEVATAAGTGLNVLDKRLNHMEGIPATFTIQRVTNLKD